MVNVFVGFCVSSFLTLQYSLAEILVIIYCFTQSAPDFSTFEPASEAEISKILPGCPNKQSDSDPIPTCVIKQCAMHPYLFQQFTYIVYLSLSSGLFHPFVKRSVISPVLKNQP